MSTYWRLHCADCDSHDMDGINHGETILREMVVVGRAVVEAVATLPDQAWFDHDLRVSGYHAPLTWLAEHRGHRIVLLSEYGQEETVEWPVGIQT